MDAPRVSTGYERRADDRSVADLVADGDLGLARDELADDEQREWHRQGVVLRAYLASGVIFSVGFAIYFWSLEDEVYRLAALAAAAAALGNCLALLLEMRGKRTTAAILSQTVPIIPVICYGAVFSVEAGFGSYLFVGALATVLVVPEHRQRTRIAIVVMLVCAVIVIQAFFSREFAIAPLPPAETAALATFNRTVMTVSLFALALLLNRSARIRRRLSDDTVALHRGVANTDELTGLPNRRPVWALVTEKAERDEVISIALIDIDHFKRLNDARGHAAGDEALVKIARRLRSMTRDGDIIGRWGGEEFVAVLRGGADEALQAMERIRAAVARAGEVTVSIGVAAREPGEDPWSALRRADRALYDAKRAGRDRVFVAPTFIP
jgi:diguanylate cyclase (GGDEF)-like protein